MPSIKDSMRIGDIWTFNTGSYLWGIHITSFEGDHGDDENVAYGHLGRGNKPYRESGSVEWLNLREGEGKQDWKLVKRGDGPAWKYMQCAECDQPSCPEDDYLCRECRNALLPS